MTTHPFRRLALGGSFALLAVACGGSDDESDQATDATSDTTTVTEVSEPSGPTGPSAEDLLGMDPAELEAMLADPAALEQLIAAFDPAELEALLEQLGVALPDVADPTPGGDAGGDEEEASEEPEADDDGGSGSGDVCALGAEEIGALVGPPANATASTQSGGGEMCEWTGQPGQFGTPRTLTVTVWPGAEFYRDPTEWGEAQPEAGLGDESWYDTDAAHVMWRRGDQTIDVFVPLGGPTESELLTVAGAVDQDLS